MKFWRKIRLSNKWGNYETDMMFSKRTKTVKNVEIYDERVQRKNEKELSVVPFVVWTLPGSIYSFSSFVTRWQGQESRKTTRKAGFSSFSRYPPRVTNTIARNEPACAVILHGNVWRIFGKWEIHNIGTNSIYTPYLQNTIYEKQNSLYFYSHFLWSWDNHSISRFCLYFAMICFLIQPLIA